MTHWIYLVLAGCCEIAWATGLKFSHGFSRPLPSIFTVAAMITSFYLLSLALRHLPLGTAYAIWTGIGAVGAFVMGMVLFHESPTLAQTICICCIVTGIVGLKLTTP